MCKYRKIESNNTDKTEYSKTTKENSTSKYAKNVQRHTIKLKPEEQNNFGAKYDNWDNMEKELRGLEEDPKVKINLDLLVATLKFTISKKCKVMMA